MSNNIKNWKLEMANESAPVSQNFSDANYVIEVDRVRTFYFSARQFDRISNKTENGVQQQQLPGEIPCNSLPFLLFDQDQTPTRHID